MDVFITGVVTLLFFTIVFYGVFFGFVFYWHLKKITFVIVPILFTFEFFWRGVVIVVLVSVAFKYLPPLINYFNL